METWENIAEKLEERLGETFKADWDRDNKCVTFIRKAFLRRTSDVASYEDKAEIFVYGNKHEIVVKRGIEIGFYNLDYAVSQTLMGLKIGCLVEESPDKKVYSWKSGLRYG